MARQTLFPWLCGMLVFGAALWQLCPTVAPYRDAGEMVAGTFSLNILHPPAYPLYTLAGRIALEIIPFGNVAYRLNILSGFFQAFAAGLASWILMRLKIQPLLAILGAILWSLTKSVFHLSLVSEMYSLGGLCAMALLGCLTISPRAILLASFFLGLALTNRTEIILAFPALCVLAIGERISRRRIVLSLLLGLFGFSVYLYLPIRSMQNPPVNWANPSTMPGLMEVLTRKTHGHTLDLISTHYKTLEVFIPQMKIYSKQLFKEWHWIGICFIFFGIFWKGSSARLRLGLALFFILTGPLFIWLARMPPNPHAIAIVQAHYLLPSVALLFLAVFGFQAVWEIFPLKAKWLLPILILAIASRTLRISREEINLRENFWAGDHARSIFRHLPKGGVAVAKKDVQLFSLWALESVGLRRDATVISQGLSSSLWYQKGVKTIEVTSLKTREGWETFLSRLQKRPLQIGLDCDGLQELSRPLFPAGLGYSETPPAQYRWDEFLASHGPVRLKDSDGMDFFTKDIQEQYANSSFQYARHLLKTGKAILAEALLRNLIENIQPEFPLAHHHLAYLALQRGDRASAEGFYATSATQYKRLLENAQRFMALPQAEQGIRRDLADVLTNYAAILEKQGRLEEAELLLQEAIRADPAYAESHYNLAVVYWHRRDWARAVQELRETLRLSPTHEGARKYLALLEKR